MSATSKADHVRQYAAVLRGFGLSRSDLEHPHEGEGELTPQSVADDLEVFRPGNLHDRLRSVLARSAKGIEAPKQYWSQAPAFQVSEVLAPLGYDVSFEGEDGVGESFEIVLEGGPTTGTRRMEFTYPAGRLGTDNYPALLHAIETRLLPEPELTFVRLAQHNESEPWRFVLIERNRLAKLRRKLGERVEVFGAPLLAEKQPADFAVEDARGGVDADGSRTADLEGVVSDSGFDDVFRDIEREVATRPVGDAVDPERLDVDPDVASLLDSVEIDREEAAAMDEVSADRLRGIRDRTGPAAIATGDASTFEWLSDDAARTSSGTDRDRQRRSTRSSSERGGISEQVAETLFPEETTTDDRDTTTEESTGSAGSTDPDPAEFLDESLQEEASRVFGDLGSPSDDADEDVEIVDATGTDDSGDEDVEIVDATGTDDADRDDGSEDTFPTRTGADPDDGWDLSSDGDGTDEPSSSSAGPLTRLTSVIRRIL